MTGGCSDGLDAFMFYSSRKMWSATVLLVVSFTIQNVVFPPRFIRDHEDCHPPRENGVSFFIPPQVLQGLEPSNCRYNNPAPRLHYFQSIIMYYPERGLYIFHHI